MQTLREHQLHSKYKKHEFWLEEVVFLGHVISNEGIKADLQTMKAVTRCPRHTNVIETRNFLGLAGYYQVSGRICQITSSQTILLKEATKLARR